MKKITRVLQNNNTLSNGKMDHYCTKQDPQNRK